MGEWVRACVRACVCAGGWGRGGGGRIQFCGGLKWASNDDGERAGAELRTHFMVTLGSRHSTRTMFVVMGCL